MNKKFKCDCRVSIMINYVADYGDYLKWLLLKIFQSDLQEIEI